MTDIHGQFLAHLFTWLGQPWSVSQYLWCAVRAYSLSLPLPLSLTLQSRLGIAGYLGRFRVTSRAAATAEVRSAQLLLSRHTATVELSAQLN